MRQTSSSPSTARQPKLLDEVRAAIRTKHYSRSMEKAYVHWIKRFILFHNKRHPAAMAEADIWAYLNHLAVKTWRRDPTQIPANKTVSTRIAYGEAHLEKPVMAAAGEWNRQKQVWRLAYGEVQAPDLRQRMVSEVSDRRNMQFSDQVTDRRNTGVSNRRNIRILFVYGDICF